MLKPNASAATLETALAADLVKTLKFIEFNEAVAAADLLADSGVRTAVSENELESRTCCVHRQHIPRRT